MINLSFQYAHQNEIGERRGRVDADEAVAAFRAFPWEEQLKEANELQICGPSLFLDEADESAQFFVSILYGDELNFMLYFARTEEVEGWSLFGKRWKRKRVSDDSYDHDRETVERGIRAFFDDRPTLLKLIRSKA